MPAIYFHWLAMPRSLRLQFMVALSIPALLIIAAGIIAVNGSRISSETIRQTAEVRMIRLQQVQALAQGTLMIERGTYRLLTADSLDAMQFSYLEILNRLDNLDSLVLRFSQESNDLSVLALHQANQLFRNTVHIVAQLRKNQLTTGSGFSNSDNQKKMLSHLHDGLERQSKSIADAAGRLSVQFTHNFRETMQRVSATSEQRQFRMLAFLTGSVLFAYGIAFFFLSKRVVTRLQKVSNALRLKKTSEKSGPIAVHGHDEIAGMAHAVEQFLEDRRLLVKTQHDLRKNEVALRTVIAELERTVNQLSATNRRIVAQQKSVIEEERLQVLLQMAGATAHELNQPLMVLLGSIEIMRARPQINPVDLERINAAGQKIAKIVRNIQQIRHYETRPYAGSERIIQIEQPVTVLSVDDGGRDHLQLTDYLAGEDNIKHLHVADHAQAFDLLNETAVDLILLDNMLPDGSGIDFLKSLADRDLDIPVVMVTEGGDEVLVSQGIQAGAYDYLPKSNLDPTTLKNTIDTTLQKHRYKLEIRKMTQKLERMTSRMN